MSTALGRGGYLRQAWLVILLALVYGGGLSGVQSKLSGKIAENKRAETYDVMPILVPGADKARTMPVVIQGKDGKETQVYQAMAPDGTHKGWVVPAGGQGFADRIELLIGLGVDMSTITGLYVLEQKETPGLGDHISGEEFRDRFVGRPTDGPLAVRAEPQSDSEVRPITGATISSKSVAGIVNDALANVKQPILERPATGLPATGAQAGDQS
jgi:electron transport complex protein RnfG